jgi:hypothetical protein
MNIERSLSNKTLASLQDYDCSWDPGSSARVKRELKRRARKREHTRHAGHETHQGKN